jgi:hypothetical protein
MSVPMNRPYADAGRCGVALGLVLLASFVLAGRGLGASGAFAAAAGETLDLLGVPVTAPALVDRIPVGLSFFDDWIVLEIIGVMIGGALSAWMAGRMRFGRIAKTSGAGRPLSRERRTTRAFAGGTLMGLGARLAYGCTSGLALSGGAVMATGAWVFIPIAFGTGMAVTLLGARQLEDA